MLQGSRCWWPLFLAISASSFASWGLLQEGQGDARSKCLQSLVSEAGTLHIGQRWGDHTPTASLDVNLQKVKSAASSFDFRTFDPEGVIFYGDMNPGIDWFVLGLRKGKPEIQIHNSITNIAVSGGLRLNDGLWHQIIVKNEGSHVILEADGDEILVLSYVSRPIIEFPTNKMRIGVGGLLIPVQDLLIPMNPAMDGCFRRWNWLNETTEWQEGAALALPGTKGCFPTISRGSFFPGNAHARFPLSGLPSGLSPANGSWSLAVDMWVRMAEQTGTFLAVSPVGQTPVFSLTLQPGMLIAALGNQTILRLPLPKEGCQDSHLLLGITPSHLLLRLGDAEISEPIQKPDFEALGRLWLSKMGHLFIGGLPGEEASAMYQTGGFFRGCLRSIRVQGYELDLDSVQYRSHSIWAHSCPGYELKPLQASGT